MSHHPIEQEQLEQPISEEEGTVFRLLVEAMPLAIFACCEGRIQYANPAGDALLGAKEIEDVIDREFFRFVVERDRKLVRHLLETPQRELRWRPVRIVQCNGEELRADISSAPLADGCVLVLVRKSFSRGLLRFSSARSSHVAEPHSILREEHQEHQP
jgi:PAS domain S-box-containing protein